MLAKGRILSTVVERRHHLRRHHKTRERRSSFVVGGLRLLPRLSGSLRLSRPLLIRLSCDLRSCRKSSHITGRSIMVRLEAFLSDLMCAVLISTGVFRAPPSPEPSPSPPPRRERRDEIDIDIRRKYVQPKPYKHSHLQNPGTPVATSTRKTSAFTKTTADTTAATTATATSQIRANSSARAHALAQPTGTQLPHHQHPEVAVKKQTSI